MEHTMQKGMKNHASKGTIIGLKQQNIIRIPITSTIVSDYTRSGIIRHRFLSLHMRAFMGRKVIFDIIGLLMQLTLTKI